MWIVREKTALRRAGAETERRHTNEHPVVDAPCLVALLYGASGVMKIFVFDKESEGGPSFGALPRGAWRALGILELVCSAGLIVPAALQWYPAPTVVTAGLTMECLVFVWVQAQYHEIMTIILSGIVTPRSGRWKRSIILLGFFAAAALTFAQSTAPATRPTQTVARPPLAFEVISIRPAKPGSNWMIGWATTPNGYRVTGQSLWYTIMIAYFPQGIAYWSEQRLSGAPPWLDDLYDIDARVSESDLAEWQRQGMTLDKKVLLQQMLQTMLAERCHLVAHRIPGGEISGLSLEPGKRGPHLTETKPAETFPAGIKLPSGGVLVPYSRGEKPRMSFYGATMADLASQFSLTSGGHPVEDHTGLTGRYDFVINWLADLDSNMPEGLISTDDPYPLSHWDIESLGLHLAPAKLPIDTLVIDHIEKPSEN